MGELTLRVAIAEDEPELAHFYKTIISRLGHKVVSMARSGREVLEHCRIYSPDIVVTDLRMPGGSGLDAIRECTGDQRFIVITGQDESEEESAYVTRIIARLTKPIKGADLTRAISLATELLGQST